jgi:hypothetical protein
MDQRIESFLTDVLALAGDQADELRVIRQLSLASRRFLEQLKYHRLILNMVMSSCAEKDAMLRAKKFRRHGAMPLR